MYVLSLAVVRDSDNRWSSARTPMKMTDLLLALFVGVKSSLFKLAVVLVEADIEPICCSSDSTSITSKLKHY